MNGWKYEWAGELPPDVYAVLVEEMQIDLKRQREP